MRNRFVVSPHHLEAQLPFVLLVEDFIDPGTGFHMHPHRGLETVTFFLSGQMRHGDHLGGTGILDGGDVQWMTAGRGIEHGGEPVGGPVHGLQLWIALPAHLRGSDPGTREQRRAAAELEAIEGGTIATYGVGGTPAGAAWSRWPLRIVDVQLDPGASAHIPVRGGERAFFYVLAGEVGLGSAAYLAGDIVWLDDDLAVRGVAVTATAPSRLILYASPPFDEPIVAHGPFVAGSMAEIEQAYADLEAGKLTADARGGPAPGLPPGAAAPK
ncbi:MAG: pirin family protein [Sphingopyxis sp.]|nr:pirin family protein [Sphingopyxis sp.]